MSIFESEKFGIYWHTSVKENSEIRIQLLHPVMEKFLGDLKGKITFDAGCGDGFSTKLLSESTTIYAGDINEYLLKTIQIDEVNFMKLDLNKKIPFEHDFFDVILCSNVLMNLTEETVLNTLKEFRRTLKHTGHIVISIVHPLYNLFANQSKLGHISQYGLHERVMVNTMKGYDSFEEFRRPLWWYFNMFIQSGFFVSNFEEIFVEQFKGITDKHIQRMGFPIFAVFKLE